MPKTDPAFSGVVESARMILNRLFICRSIQRFCYPISANTEWRWTLKRMYGIAP